MSLDRIDRKILSALQDDNKITNLYQRAWMLTHDGIPKALIF